MDLRYSGAKAKKLPLDDYQNRFQQKISCISHSKGLSFNNGPTKPLKANHHLNPEMKFSCIPLIKWNCPPKFSIDYEWKVAFGEESEERATQMHREVNLVEAVYPHFSSIPPSPLEPLEICNLDDDSNIPIIPIIPIEEALESPSLDVVAAGAPSTTVLSQPPDHAPCSSAPGNINTHLNLLAASGGDVAADAAYVALTALTKSQEMGNLIDKDLLIQILSNPKLIEKLTDKTGNKPICGPVKTVTQPVTFTNVVNKLANENVTPRSWSSSVAGSKPVTSSVPLPSSKPDLVTIKRLINEYGPPDKTGKDSGFMSANVGSNVTSPTHPPIKDKNYFKSLIKEHGKRQELQVAEPVKKVKLSEYESKYEEPCIYFNSPRGCRRGSACLYKHIFLDRRGSGPVGAKRLRL